MHRGKEHERLEISHHRHENSKVREKRKCKNDRRHSLRSARRSLVRVKGPVVGGILDADVLHVAALEGSG